MLFRCIRTLGNDDVTTLNKIYESTNYNNNLIKIINDKGNSWHANIRRFEEIDELRKGDIVTVRRNLSTVINPIIDYTEEMEEFEGKQVTISEIVHNAKTYYHIENDDENWAWGIDMFDFNLPKQKTKPVKEEINIFESFNT